MTQETVTLVIGLAGIVSTLIVSSIGFYYTSKGRKIGLRDKLFEKQIEIIVRLFHKQSRIRVFSDVLRGKDMELRERAREDIGNLVMEYCEIEEQSAAILPVELWIEIKRLTEFYVDFVVAFDNNNRISEPMREEMLARITKISLLSRTVLGVDELTEESIALFSSPKEYEKLAGLELDHFKKASKQTDRLHA
jgi:hypothetical protein